MTLDEFKSRNGIVTLNFYKSTKSNRHVAGFGNDELLITTADFDPKKPAFVYGNPEDGEGKSHILSNTAPKEAVFTL